MICGREDEMLCLRLQDTEKGSPLAPAQALIARVVCTRNRTIDKLRQA